MISVSSCAQQYKKLGKALEFDVSLLERLYTGDDRPGISKTMLDVSFTKDGRRHWLTE